MDRGIGILLCTLAFAGCAHPVIVPDPKVTPAATANAPAPTPPTAAPEPLTARERIARELADALLRDMTPRAGECTGDPTAPVRTTVIGTNEAQANTIADLIAVRLANATTVRISNRAHRARVLAVIAEELGRGAFDEATVHPTGDFQGVDALVVVDAHAEGSDVVYVAHMTCVRTLLDLAAASSNFPSVDSEAMMRYLLRGSQRARGIVCAEQPLHPACRHTR